MTPPYHVPCPKCGSPAGIMCVMHSRMTFEGLMTAPPHAQRQQAATLVKPK